jgi:hypothetical protein
MTNAVVINDLEINYPGTRYSEPVNIRESRVVGQLSQDQAGRLADEAIQNGAQEVAIFRPGIIPEIVVPKKPFSFNVETNDTTKFITPNPLLENTSYTYNVSLHLLSTTSYNNLMGNDAITPEQQFNYRPENVLISSGGRSSTNSATEIDYVSGTTSTTNKKQRHPYWQDDFYFDDIRILTVIGPGKVNRGTNAVEGSFRIIEPNGFTLINRLVNTAQDVNPGGNYIFMPYMLQIDFYAIDGNIEIAGATSNPKKLDQLTKFFPILFTGIKTKVTNRGAEYLIDFVPYSHSSLNKIRNVVPADFQIRASTVQQFFDNTQNPDLRASIQEYKNRIKVLNDLKVQRANLNRVDPNTGLDTVSASGGNAGQLGQELDQAIKTLGNEIKNTKFASTGFCEAYNAWHDTLVTDKQDSIADQFEVKFHKDIRDSAIFSRGAPVDINQTAVNPNFTDKTKLEALAGKSPNSLTWDAGIVTVGAGTVIDRLIEFVVRNSDYFLSQLGTDLTLADRKKPIKWYRIIPRSKIIGYKTFSKTYAYKITWYVVPYMIYGSGNPYAPNGLPFSPVKEYNYIFTGKNDNVIDLSIDFDMMYYISLPVNRNQSGTQETGNPEVPTALSTNKNNNLPTSPQHSPPVNLMTGSQMLGSTTGGSDTDALKLIASSVTNEINKNSRGDMINVKMRIIGDPDFIKQDDVFYNYFFYDKSNARIPVGRSLWMDNGELTVQLNINSPIDYNEDLGVARPDKFTYNTFSGIYKITTVENIFSKGKFEQVVDIIRTPLQPDILTQIDKLNVRERVKPVSYVNEITVSQPRLLGAIPVRSSQSAIAQAVNNAYKAQQDAQNAAAQAAAAASAVAGGLSAGASFVQQIGGAVIGNLIGKGVNFAVDQGIKGISSIIDQFKGPDAALIGSFESAELGSSALPIIGDIPIIGELGEVVADIFGTELVADVIGFGFL